MKMSLKVGTAVALLMAAAPMAAFADSTTTTDTTSPTATQVAEVDAGKLIGQDVVDANGDTIGEIDSVMVDAKGQVQGVVIDVSSWLESEKLISMPWTDLQVSGDDKIMASNLTKESATAATTYAYADPANKGKIFTDDAATDTATGTATDTTSATATTTAAADAGELIGENVVDANGDTVGEIDSVMVDPEGQVQGVVIDVSSWLESEKLISMPWTDLQVSGDDKIVASNLTKESATAATTYAYADPANKGKVFTDDTMTGTGTGADTGIAVGTPIKNGDGSINASQLMGLKVENPNGDNVGEIGEVILDDAGAVQGIIVDVGGFLGMGEHPVMMNWKDVSLAGSGNDVKANIAATTESLKAMPVYERASD